MNPISLTDHLLTEISKKLSVLIEQGRQPGDTVIPEIGLTIAAFHAACVEHDHERLAEILEVTDRQLATLKFKYF